MLYNQAFAKPQAELAHYEEERRRLLSEDDMFRALSTKKEEEICDLRVHLETMCRERTNLAE